MLSVMLVLAYNMGQMLLRFRLHVENKMTSLHTKN